MALKKDYLEYLYSFYDVEFDKQKERQRKFLDSSSLDHMNFDSGLYMVDISLLFYEEYKENKYLTEAKEYFTNIIRAFNKYKDNNAIPTKPITNRMFGVSTFVETYMKIEEISPFTEDFKNDLYDYLVHLTKWMVDYPEWGAHNRSSIRGLGLYKCFLAFPNRKESYKWKTIGLSLIDDNLGKWAMEDASTYHPIWVEDIIEMKKLNLAYKYPIEDTIIKFYLDYFAYNNSHQFIPLEYGDGRLGTQFGHIIHALEWGAKEYHNPEYKYVADRIFWKMKEMDIPINYKINQSRAFVNAIRNMSDDIELKEIYPYSIEAVDDVISKKIIFRSGLSEEKDTTLFLNYKDELENSYLGRKNLDYTICAPSEKNHHGHSDENAINYLAYKDSVLLHDSGYREKVDLSGAFRADFYHNKLVFRNEVKDNLIDTLKQEPFYNKVETHKVYFKSSLNSDYSRTAIKDLKHNVYYDRCITYIKELNIFIVVDIVKSMCDQKLFISNQYFSQNIKRINSNIFFTKYEYIMSDEIKEFYQPTDKALSIYFLKDLNNGKIEINEIRRSYTEENILSNNDIYCFKKNETLSLVTILSPNDNYFDEELFKGISSITVENMTLVNIAYKNKMYKYAFKHDIEKGYIEEERPMYSFENTSSIVDDIKTDSLFLELIEDKETIKYSFVFGSKVIYKGKNLFEIKDSQSEFYQANCTIEIKTGSYTYYTDTIQKEA